MDIEFAARQYFSTVSAKLTESGRSYKSLRVKAIMDQFGYRRRSQTFVDSINAMLDECGLHAAPYFSVDLPLDSRIYITLKDDSRNQKNSSVKTVEKAKKENDIISVKHDLFYYLFDFGSEHEYERFEASLDSNQPIALFLLPEADDFLTDLVFRILSYELIRKYQYQGSPGIPLALSQTIGNISEDSDKNKSEANVWAGTGILRFNSSTMSSVILGETGLELLDSEEFDKKFEQLSLYANKYNQEQSFVIFQCPSQQEIRNHSKTDLLGYLIDRVSNQIPLTFTLRYKFSEESLIDCREEILAHLRLLMELPDFEVGEEEINLIDYFLELQKAQVQAESQLLLKMNDSHFMKLNWGYESDEHIYLKYFAVKTLENAGHHLQDIKCEVLVNSSRSAKESGSSNSERTKLTEHQESLMLEDINRRPDVYVTNKVIVEVETLRSKGNNTQKVFLNLVSRLIDKSSGWPKHLQEIWLVLPGFEIARNYYQIKKSQEILNSLLPGILSPNIKLIVMAPDYESHQLIPVSFDALNYPSLQITPTGITAKPTNENRRQAKLTSFADVAGLGEEKQKLQKILQLQERGHACNINGIIFYGLPGCGKTLLARAFASESERYFLQFSPADIKSVWIGQTQKNIQKIFSQAKRRCPSLLFIDELDSIGFSRNDPHAHTDQKATINQLLIELENLKNHDVLVIAATNYLSTLDGALKRSGRLDWKMPIFPPDQSERRAMYELYFSNLQIPFEDNLINFDEIAERSTRFTSSDIKAVCDALRMEVLLEEIKGSLTTSDVILHISQLQEGGLSLNQEQVSDFIFECERLGVKSSKLSVLKADWELA